jgi:hypothetical protein
MEYTHDEYCNMSLILGACNSTTGTDNTGNMSYSVLVDVIQTEMFRGLEQHLFYTWILKAIAHVIAGRPSTARTTTACKDATIVALEWELQRSSSHTARESKLVTAWLKRPWMKKWTEHVYVYASTRVLLVCCFYNPLTRDYSFAKYCILIRLSFVSLRTSSTSNDIFSTSQLI